MFAPPPPIKVERGAVAAQQWTFAKTSFELPNIAKAYWSPYPGTCVAVVSDAKVKPVGAPRGDRVEVWDAAAGKRKGALEYVPEAVQVALSPDGKHLALLVNVGSKASEVQIWSVATGQATQRWQADDKAPFGLEMRFAGDRPLIIRKRPAGKTTFDVWDVAAANLLRQIETKVHIDDKATAISPDGTRLAFFDSNGHQVVVCNLSTGRTIAELPVSKEIYSCQALAYSARGEELVGLFSLVEANLICWIPETGQRVFEWSGSSASKTGLSSGAGYAGSDLQWLPDRSGFLLFGHFLLDRQSKRIVAILETAPDDFGPPERRWIDSDRLALFAGPRKARRLQVATIPWAKIDRSMQHFNSEAPAILEPGGSISLKIQLGDVRGRDADAIIEKLTKAVSSAFDEHEIHLADDQPVTLFVRYREAQGKELEELAPGPDGRPPLFRPEATGTGRKVQSTRMVCDLSLQNTKTSETLWSRILDVDPSSIHVRGELNEASVREAVFGFVELRLSRQPYPYFIPEEKGVAPLPLVLKLPAAH